MYVELLHTCIVSSYIANIHPILLIRRLGSMGRGWARAGVAAAVPALALSFGSFQSGLPWKDDDGNLIDAHGGGMLVYGGR